MQAGATQPKRWEKMISHAGSPSQILSMKDSIHGDSSLSFGEGAGHFLPYHAFDFWLNLALCHALLVDTSEGKSSYQVCVVVAFAQGIVIIHNTAKVASGLRVCEAWSGW
jgi:hypothetical protein